MAPMGSGGDPADGIGWGEWAYMGSDRLRVLGHNMWEGLSFPALRHLVKAGGNCSHPNRAAGRKIRRRTGISGRQGRRLTSLSAGGDLAWQDCAVAGHHLRGDRRA
ncbi:hypothetical protein GCM10007856_58550 [Azospirillum oryzae]|nr:hypothetical protein GCM10007856_58550 [Azospirillum oryzae]